MLTEDFIEEMIMDIEELLNPEEVSMFKSLNTNSIYVYVFSILLEVTIKEIYM